MKNTFIIITALLLAPLAALHASQPVVFWVSDPIEPGQTALLFGDGIGADVIAEGERVPDGPVSGPPETAPAGKVDGEKLDVLQTSDLCAKVALPDKWTPGLYAIRLKNKNGESQPIYLNRTEPWWWLGGSTNAALGVTGDVAVPGEELRVFGKNFGAKTRAWLGQVALEPVKAEKYAATFRVPANLAPGDYALHVHNGFGGALGFGAPLNVKVASAKPWPTTQFNVRDFGARGDSVGIPSDQAPDDTPAFEAALAKAAANGGGVVFVPRGNYKITGKLVVPPKTILRGEKREWVWLYSPKQLLEFDAVIAGNGDFAVEELSIVAKTARRMVVCPDVASMYSRQRGGIKAEQVGHNAHLRRLNLLSMRYDRRGERPANDPIRIEAEGMSAITLAGPDMEISDCDVVSSGASIVLHSTHRSRICGNRFGNGRSGCYIAWDTERTVYENNVFESRDSEATGGGFQEHVYRTYFAGNTFRHSYGLDREALTLDSPSTATWRGQIAKAEGETLTARDYSGAATTWTPGALKGQACYVAFGKGLGQYIPIADNSATTLTLARPFAVPLDATSHIAVVMMKTEVVVANNIFSDQSVAVQLYCQCYGMIVDGNRSERTGGMHGYGGGTGWKEQRKQFHLYICSFNQFLNNELSEGFVYQQGPSLTGLLGVMIDGPVNQPPAIIGIGNVVRNNRVRDHNTVGSTAGRAHPFTLTPPADGMDCVCRDTLIEGNTITDTPLALDVFPFHRDTLLRNNHVERSARPLRDDGANTWIAPAERFAYQREAVRALLGDVTATDLASLWAAVARAWPQGVPPEVAGALVGLRYEIAPFTLLAAGRSGKADVEIGVRTEPWSPALDVKCEVVPPEGWPVTNGDAMNVPPFKIVNFKSTVVVPPNADIKTLPVRFIVTLAGVPLTVADRIDVARRDLTQWMVIGPFANASGTLLDTSVQPPETRLDLAAEYPSLAGPAKWQPVALPNRYLDLEKVFGRDETVTALAVACLRSDKAVSIELGAGCRGGLQMWLNNRQVLSLSSGGWGGKTIRLDLQEGDNILFCKSSAGGKGSWKLTVEYKELTLDEKCHVRQVPAAELKTVKALMPPAPQPMRAGTLEHAGGVAWRQVFADDFDRRLVGNAWKAVSGEWAIQNDALVGKGPGFLALTEKVSPPVRIEYDARGEAPEDLSCFWLRDPATISSGCLFAFGSGGSGSRLVIDGSKEASSDTTEAKAAPNLWYHVIAQVLPDGKVQLIVNGRELLMVRHKPAFTDAAHPGLWTWGASQFNHVQVFTGASQ